MVVWKEGERTCHDGLLYLDLEAFSRTGLRLERMTLGSAEAVCHFSAGEGACARRKLQHSSSNLVRPFTRAISSGLNHASLRCKSDKKNRCKLRRVDISACCTGGDEEEEEKR